MAISEWEKVQISSPVKSDNQFYLVVQIIIFIVWKPLIQKKFGNLKRTIKLVVLQQSITMRFIAGLLMEQLYCLELKTGQMRWKFETGGLITSAPLIVNNLLYIGSCDHILYALYA